MVFYTIAFVETKYLKQTTNSTRTSDAVANSYVSTAYSNCCKYAYKMGHVRICENVSGKPIQSAKLDGLHCIWGHTAI